jgi:hypothetical protein
MADIFISYERNDRSAAEAIAAGLEAHGWSVWFDRELVAGQNWDEIIERELEASRCLVVLWSSTSVKSRWVRNEARRGVERLVPATLDATRWPIEFDHLQVVDLADWNGDTSSPEFQGLVKGVAQRLGQPPTMVPSGHLSIIRRYRRQLRSLVGVLIFAAAVALAFLQPWKPPQVLVMDSPLRDVVYDSVAFTKGQTNASIITEILKDLRVASAKEATDLEWRREAEVRRMDPDLIIIHASAFYSSTNGSDNAAKLVSFLESMRDTDTRFLVYSRVTTGVLERVVRQRMPGSEERIRFWQVPGGPAANFNEPATRRRLLQLVREVLSI